jgi:nitrite reductase/ring-hydroxylating ferredoxin subunit
VRLCHIDELPEGAARGFDPQLQGHDTVIVVRRAGALHAYANACPHYGTPMAWRKDAYLNAAGDRIVCAAHGALFEIDTGLCTLGPCLGDRLRALPIHVQPDGEVRLNPSALTQETPS